VEVKPIPVAHTLSQNRHFEFKALERNWPD
jgi:hypothetical protein